MRKEERETWIRRKKAITAVIAFINADLTPLAPRDRIEVFQTLHAALSAVRELDPALLAFDKRWIRQEAKTLTHLQNSWKESLNHLLDLLKERWRLEFTPRSEVLTWNEGGDNRFHCKDSLQQVFKGTYETLRVTARRAPEHWSGGSSKSIDLEEFIAKEKENTCSLDFPFGADSFFRALAGFPTTALMRCPNCQRIFFNASRRVKEYCSARCQKTASVKRVYARKKKGGR